MRQITLPFSISLLVVLVLGVLAVMATSQNASLWGDISLIYLILVAGIVSVSFLAVLAGLAYAMIQLNHALPPRARVAQDFLGQIAVSVRAAADKLVQPILRVEGFMASARAARRTLRERSVSDHVDSSQ